MSTFYLENILLTRLKGYKSEKSILPHLKELLYSLAEGILKQMKASIPWYDMMKKALHLHRIPPKSP